MINFLLKLGQEKSNFSEMRTLPIKPVEPVTKPLTYLLNKNWLLANQRLTLARYHRRYYYYLIIWVLVWLVVWSWTSWHHLLMMIELFCFRFKFLDCCGSVLMMMIKCELLWLLIIKINDDDDNDVDGDDIYHYIRMDPWVVLSGYMVFRNEYCYSSIVRKPTKILSVSMSSRSFSIDRINEWSKVMTTWKTYVCVFEDWGDSTPDGWSIGWNEMIFTHQSNDACRHQSSVSNRNIYQTYAVGQLDKRMIKKLLYILGGECLLKRGPDGKLISWQIGLGWSLVHGRWWW